MPLNRQCSIKPSEENAQAEESVAVAAAAAAVQASPSTNTNKKELNTTLQHATISHSLLETAHTHSSYTEFI